MASFRRRNLLSSRRRVDEEGEDEDGGVYGPQYDTQSEGSVLSPTEGDLDADDSDSDIGSGPIPNASSSTIQVNGYQTASKRRKKATGRSGNAQTVQQLPSVRTTFAVTADMDAMMNGLHRSGDAAEIESIHFEDTLHDIALQLPSKLNLTDDAKESYAEGQDALAPRRLREQEQYKTKRALALAPASKRGGFFMHDQRHGQHARGYSARGPGRDMQAMSNDPAVSHVRTPDSRSLRWDHDLHESLTPFQTIPLENSVRRGFAPGGLQPVRTQARVSYSMSRSVLMSTVSVRVFLPGMVKAKIFEKVLVKQHTRLPDLRPPLRRDKPVRVSLPNHVAHYIFPSIDRSFIFIPRAQRPNLQSRSRGHFSQHGSRKGSIYGESGYSPSIAMSRRSSVAHEKVMSPIGSTTSRAAFGAPKGPARPVVRLPAGNQHYRPARSSPPHTFDIITPSVNLPHGTNYPLPSAPTYRENRSNHIPMHQPRPHKTVSVATIESPKSTSIQAPLQKDQQPFHYQVPAHIGDQSVNQEQTTGYAPVRQISFQGQVPEGRPPSNMAERVMHAQPLQPTAAQPPYYAPAYADMNMYYYSSMDGQPDQYSPALLGPPVYVSQPPQQATYLVPMLLPSLPSAEGQGASTQGATMSYEANGMVYFYDPAQMLSNADGFAQANYSIPSINSVAAVGPAQDGFYYTPAPQGLLYYPPQ